MRFCTNWQIYADDVTIRTGRWLDGTYYSDADSTDRLREAQQNREASQPSLDDAFKALGFNPQPLGEEGKLGKAEAKPKTKAEQAKIGLGRAASSDPSPYAYG